jgi:hypothetical protein
MRSAPRMVAGGTDGPAAPAILPFFVRNARFLAHAQRCCASEKSAINLAQAAPSFPQISGVLADKAVCGGANSRNFGALPPTLRPNNTARDFKRKGRTHAGSKSRSSGIPRRHCQTNSRALARGRRRARQSYAVQAAGRNPRKRFGRVAHVAPTRRTWRASVGSCMNGLHKRNGPASPR